MIGTHWFAHWVAHRLAHRAARSVAAASFALCLGACSRDEPPLASSDPSSRPPDVLFVTLDTFRADRAGCMGNPHGLTPALDRALRRGLLAASAFAPAPLTAISHASLLTGLEPMQHGVRENALYVLSENLKTIPAHFREKGFATAGFIAALPLARPYGFANGFDHFDDTLETARAGVPEYAERPASLVVDSVLAYLDAADSARRFLWVHFFDAHFPRRLLPVLARFPAVDDYDREIRAMDLQLDRLIRGIELRRGAPVIAIATDHGEGLGAHGEVSHGVLLYADTMHAIFGLSAPAGSAEAERVRPAIEPGVVRFIDLFPTLVHALGIEPPPDLPGRSLFEPPPQDLAAYGETYYSVIHYGWSPILSLRTDEWTYIDSPAPELFDRRRDPGEKKSLLAEHRETAHRLAARLEAMAVEPAPLGERTVDEEESDKLASLGYVAGTSGRRADPRKDPKALIGVANALFRGMSLEAEGRLPEALQFYQRAYRDDPENFSVLFQLADCLRQMGDEVTAMAYYRKAIAMDPAASEAVNHLAVLTYRQGDAAAAVALVEKGLTHNPRSFALWMTRGDLELWAGRPKTAALHYHRASELEPMRAVCWIALADAARAMNRGKEAEEFLTKARGIDPMNPRLPERRAKERTF
jgi:arylsulfatase A-like enzyme